MPAPVEEFVRALAEARGAALLALDFDGTLAEVVDDPAAAAPAPGVTEVVSQAATRWGAVAIVSGRPLAFLDGRFPDPAVTLVGLYGLEVRRDGRRDDHPAAASWRSAVDRAVELARSTLPEEVGVEPKGASLTLHYRTCPSRAGEVGRVAADLSDRTGLVARGARMSVELHPPVHVDKGTVVSELAAGLTGPVCFVGDDLGDVPALAALERLRVAGRPTLAVAVVGPETPVELRAGADVEVAGPAAVVELLARLDA